MRKQLTDLLLRPDEYQFQDRVVHAVCDKVSLLILSIDPVNRRGRVDIFHSLVLMLGMFPFHAFIIQHRIHQGLIPPDPLMHSETCPIQILSHELLETIAGTVKNCQSRNQLGQDSTPFWNFVHAWRSLIGTPARPSSDLIRSLSYLPNEPTGSLYPPLSKIRSRPSGCSDVQRIPFFLSLKLCEKPQSTR